MCTLVCLWSIILEILMWPHKPTKLAFNRSETLRDIYWFFIVSSLRDYDNDSGPLVTTIFLQ